MVQEHEVREALRQVIDPELSLDIVELGMVGAIDLDAGSVTVGLRLTSGACPFWEIFQSQVAAAVSPLRDVTDVRVRLDSTVAWSPAMMTEAARSELTRVGQILPMAHTPGCGGHDRDAQLLQIAQSVLRSGTTRAALGRTR